MKFRHSGKLGDIVYSLAAVQVFGGSSYFINADKQHTSPEIAALILPLLKYQPYIREAGLWEDQPFDVDLDQFRQFAGVMNNLADCHLMAMGMPLKLRNLPWLHAPTHPIAPEPVLFSRSGSFHGAPGVMEALYSVFGKSAAFVGLPAEHHQFCANVGPIDYIETRDLLELASVISACKLFIGNQSCPLAIAEAQKVPVIQEVDHRQPNCIFHRTGAVPVWHMSQLSSTVAEASQWLT